MIHIKEINLFDTNNELIGCIEGNKFQKIAFRFFEILNTKECSDNCKYLQLASLFGKIDEDIASYCFNKVDHDKLNILDQLVYAMVYASLTNT